MGKTKMINLKNTDPEIFSAINKERIRQSDGLELIASENFTSLAVMEATGTVLTNKYAEGPSGRRYYGGCEMVDIAEDLACERACKLFGADYANVQPHSGSQANMAVYMSALVPGDRLLAMDLDAGGHLTHGSPVNFSGRLYDVSSYGVREDDERIDYDDVEKKAHANKPKLIVAGASAYPRQIDYERFAKIAADVGALFMVDMAHVAGLIAAGLHANPVPLADYVTSTTHKTLRGPRGGFILAKQQYKKKLDSAVCPRIQGGPLMHVIAAKAVGFLEASKPDFTSYQQRTIDNAKALGNALIEKGYRLVSGGTDNHLLLVDLRPKKMTGKTAEKVLDSVGITVNKNKVPFDPEKPMVTSGIRIGTPALTTRGMGIDEMGEIAELIAEALEHTENDTVLKKIHAEVQGLAKKFPLYPELVEE